MRRRPPRSTQSRSSAASDVYKRQERYDAEIATADREIGRLLASLGGDLEHTLVVAASDHGEAFGEHGEICLLYTSDAADDLLCVDLGGRRIIKKKNKLKNTL